MNEIIANKFIEILEQARKVANEIEDPYNHAGFLLDIAEITKDINDIEKAREIASKIEDPYTHARALIRISEILV